MISLISGEAVELVDDEIIDSVLFIRAEANGIYEFSAFSSFGRFSFFHEYFQYLNMLTRAEFSTDFFLRFKRSAVYLFSR